MSVYREILLTQNKVALVDSGDYEWLSQWKWRCKKKNHTYIARRVENKTEYKTRETRRSIYMHRVILMPTKGQPIDHRNHNGLDNRRCNIRICTTTQNAQNRKRIRGTSQFKGVWFHGPKWAAQIVVHTNKLYLGHFDTEQEAAIAYDIAAIQHFGEFARLNFRERG